MWPLQTDYTKEECLGIIRALEVKAYSSVVDALRAGGELTEEKNSLLSLLRTSLRISTERHKTEVRRALNDEVLNTVANRLCGPDQLDDWRKEGRRIIPLLPRAAPVTGYTQIADAAKAEIAELNGELPPPWETRTVGAPPPLKRDPGTPPPSSVEPAEMFVKPEPVDLNGSSPEKIKVEIKEEKEEDETGFVYLPSGMTVRLREDKSATIVGKKGGKRKRSVSKSIEVFHKGEPISSVGRRGSASSPPRKISSPLSPVHQAGHGYARPPLSMPNLPPPSAAPAPATSSAPTATPKLLSSEGQLFTPPKRGPGRPPSSSSPSLGRGQGRARAPRAPRARGARSRGRAAANMGRGAAANTGGGTPVVISQSPLVQGPSGQSSFTPLGGARKFRTSTPKLAGLSQKDVLTNFQQQIGVNSVGLNLSSKDPANYPQDLSLSSADTKVALQNLQYFQNSVHQHPPQQQQPQQQTPLPQQPNIQHQLSAGQLAAMSQPAPHHLPPSFQVSGNNSHLSLTTSNAHPQLANPQLPPSNSQILAHSQGPFQLPVNSKLVTSTKLPTTKLPPNNIQQSSHALTVNSLSNKEMLTASVLNSLAGHPATQVSNSTTLQVLGGTPSTMQMSSTGGGLVTNSINNTGQPQNLSTTATATAFQLAPQPPGSIPQPHQQQQQTFSQLPGGQGLKVLSAPTSTKIVPKSGSTVYVVPGTAQRLISPNPRVVTVSMAAGASRTSTSSVIRTIRTSNFSNLPGSKSVIVVQKPAMAAAGQAAPIRASRPGSVALYRPARGVSVVSRAGGPTVSGSNLVRMPGGAYPRPTLIRQQGANGSVYLVELGHQGGGPGSATTIQNTGITSVEAAGPGSLQRIISKPILPTTKPLVVSSSSQTLAKKIYVQTSSAESKNQDIWLQMSGSKTAEAASGGGNDEISNYSDIFSAAMEQANIGAVDPHLAAPPPPPPTIEPKPASMSNAGRFVTLPPRSGNTSVQILPNSPKRDAMTVEPPPKEAVATATCSVIDETSTLNEQNGLNTQNHVS